MVAVVGQAENVKKRITCRNCGAILEYVKADIKEYRGTDISGGSDGREWIVCPQCSEQVTIRSW